MHGVTFTVSSQDPWISMIEWNNSFLTGHAMVDADHQHLILIINELEAAISTGKGAAEIRGIIGQLSAYTVAHFSREEELMERVGCAAQAQNCAAHRTLMLKLDAWSLRLQQGEGVSLALEVFRECNAWLKDHILRVDCQLRCCKPE
jgi:hemerythrin-like metal-binding protein